MKGFSLDLIVEKRTHVKMISPTRAAEMIIILFMLPSLIKCVVIDIQGAKEYLLEFGYFEKANKNELTQITNETTTKAIAKFQERYSLPVDGTLNAVTLQHFNLKRCGNEDSVGYYRLASVKWASPNLTWSFLSATEEILKCTRAAFDVWSSRSNLNFKEVFYNANITIQFGQGKHSNCSTAFDGQGRVLAHASFPSSGSTSTYIHIDKDEHWHFDLTTPPSANDISLFHVLVHEIGHTLGFIHSPIQDSIMYPFFSARDISTFKLIDDDWYGVWRFYGEKGKPVAPERPGEKFQANIEPPSQRRQPPITTTTTTARPRFTAPPITTTIAPEKKPIELCLIKKPDVILIISHSLYILYGKWVYIVNLQEKKTPRYKVEKITNWLNFLPEDFTRVSHAYQRPNGEIVMFVKQRIYILHKAGFTLVKELHQSELGITSDKKLCAVLNTYTGRTYLFYSKNNLVEIDECTFKNSGVSPTSETFPGIPPTVRTAFRYKNGLLYFLHKDKFFEFNEFTKEVVRTGTFDLGLVDIECPNQGIFDQLREVLQKILNMQTQISEYKIEDSEEEDE